jgi:hypothetical protein
MPRHSRPKDGVASLAYRRGIQHVVAGRLDRPLSLGMTAGGFRLGLPEPAA